MPRSGNNGWHILPRYFHLYLDNPQASQRNYIFNAAHHCPPPPAVPPSPSVMLKSHTQVPPYLTPLFLSMFQSIILLGHRSWSKYHTHVSTSLGLPATTHFPSPSRHMGCEATPTHYSRTQPLPLSSGSLFPGWRNEWKWTASYQLKAKDTRYAQEQ